MDRDIPAPLSRPEAAYSGIKGENASVGNHKATLMVCDHTLFGTEQSVDQTAVTLIPLNLSLLQPIFLNLRTPTAEREHAGRKLRSSASSAPRDHSLQARGNNSRGKFLVARPYKLCPSPAFLPDFDKESQASAASLPTPDSQQYRFRCQPRFRQCLFHRPNSGAQMLRPPQMQFRLRASSPGLPARALQTHH